MKKAYYIYLAYSGGIFFLFYLVFSINSYFRVTVVGLDPLQLVLLGTLLEGSILVFEIPTGMVADLYSRKLSIIVGVFLMGLAYLLEGFFPVYAVLLVEQVVAGLGWTFTSGALQAWISDEIGEEAAGQAFLHGAQMEQVGALAGIIASTLLANLWIRLPFLVCSGLMVLGALVLIFVMPETGFKPAPAEERNTWQKMGDTLRRAKGMLRQRPALGSILWVGLFIGLYSEGFDRLWVAHVTSQFSFPLFSGVTWMGIIQGSAMLLTALVMEGVKRRVEISNQRTLLLLQTLIVGLIVSGLVGFALTGQFFTAVVIFILISILRGVESPLYTTWTNHHLDPQVRATILSISSLVDSVGQASGGPLMGAAARQAGTRWGLLTSAGLLAPVMGVFGRMIARREE
jgi:MFS transporter, DHA3 family, tetracycline resistance protein